MVAAAILSVGGAVLTPRDRAFLREADPWGMILFGRNVENPGQLAALVSDIRLALGRDCPVLVDQEGGRVQRLTPPHWRRWLPPLEEAERAGGNARRAIWLRGAMIGAELRAVGIDTNCVPCADVARPGTHPFLKNRCLGFDAELVGGLSRAMAEGLMAGGCLPVVKHLPGHGGATADSHLALPRVNDDRATLAAGDFVPFRRLADMPVGMTAHVLYPAYDDAQPATLSPAMIRVIREEIGFAGLLVSDDLSMAALSGTLADRAERAIGAGCDLALYCAGVEAEAAEVLSACGRLAGGALARAEAALAVRPPAPAVDTGALAAEFAALTGS